MAKPWRNNQLPGVHSFGELPSTCNVQQSWRYQDFLGWWHHCQASFYTVWCTCLINKSNNIEAFTNDLVVICTSISTVLELLESDFGFWPVALLRSSSVLVSYSATPHIIVHSMVITKGFHCYGVGNEKKTQRMKVKIVKVLFIPRLWDMICLTSLLHSTFKSTDRRYTNDHERQTFLTPRGPVFWGG